MGSPSKWAPSNAAPDGGDATFPPAPFEKCDAVDGIAQARSKPRRGVRFDEPPTDGPAGDENGGQGSSGSVPQRFSRHSRSHSVGCGKEDEREGDQVGGGEALKADRSARFCTERLPGALRERKGNEKGESEAVGVTKFNRQMRSTSVDSVSARMDLRVVIDEAEEDTRHDGGNVLASTANSMGRTPRFKGILEKGRHTVDSTDGVHLSVKTWPGKGTGRRPALASRNLLVVIVHQYSVMGGCQDLVAGLAYELTLRGFSCVTFDQRGVGGSTGSKSLTGVPEVDDVISVCQWAAEKYGRRLLLVGNSAGAPISGSAVDAVEAVDGYVAIGYVFGVWASIPFGSHYKKILESEKPKLFIMGTKDEFTTPKQLQDKLSKAKGSNDVHYFEGCGHFQIEASGFDEAIAKLIAKFAEKLEGEGDEE